MNESLANGTHEDHVSQESAENRAVAAIVHELKNPLQIIADLLHLIGNDTCTDSTRQRLLQAQQEVERIRQITASLLEVSRERPLETEVELSNILESSLDSFKEKIEFKKITVERRIECRGIVKSAPVEIRQLFDNVVSNALEAAPFGGKIVVHVFESRDWRMPSRSGCRIVVFDNGPGIAPEHHSKIFEPFFTTKPEKGTGIGLWVAQRVVRKHNGAIHVRSSIAPSRRGTAFSIFLPKAGYESSDSCAA